MRARLRMLLPMLALLSSACPAKGEPPVSPQAATRTHAQNYKDMVLAACVAHAYKDDKGAPVDAGSSASALRDWTVYDMEQSPDAVRSLVDGYLSRDYTNPLAEAEIKGIRFDFLKCLDMYHGPELDAQARRLVIDPGRVDRPGSTAPPRP